MSAWRESQSREARVILPLLLGAAVLVLAVFVLALGTAKSLTELHVRHKVQSIAQQAAQVWREHADARGRPDAQGALLLQGLMRFRDVEALALARDGQLLWARPQGWRPPAQAPSLRLFTAAPDGIRRHFALAREQMTIAGALLEVAVKLDITGIAASYRAIALLMAKLVSSVLIAAFLVIGVLVLRRERRQAIAPDMDRLHDGMVGQLRAQAAHMRASLGPSQEEAGREPRKRQRRAG